MDEVVCADTVSILTAVMSDLLFVRLSVCLATIEW